MNATIDFSKRPAMRIRKEDRCVIRSVDAENIFTFPNGIIGFEEVKKFCFLINEKVRPFMFMQALDDQSLCFVCVESFLVRPDYKIKIPKDCLNDLELKTPNHALVLSLVTVKKNVEEITANLRSPVIINMMNSKGAQIILDECNYPLRYRVWDTLKEMNVANAG